MRVLVATNELQGRHAGDYAHTVEGELVIAEVTECADGERCGCGRGFPGLASSRATTTAMVVELPHMTTADLETAVTDYLDRAGWIDLFRSAAESDETFLTDEGFDDVDEMIDSTVEEHIDVINTICRSFPVGTVIERSGTEIRARSMPFAA